MIRHKKLMSIYNTTFYSTLCCLYIFKILYYIDMDDKNLFFTIAHNIKIERAIKCLTQAQLAELIGVHEKYVGRIEAGKQNITLKTLNRIANSLNIEITKLFEQRR